MSKNYQLATKRLQFATILLAAIVIGGIVLFVFISLLSSKNSVPEGGVTVDTGSSTQVEERLKQSRDEVQEYESNPQIDQRLQVSQVEDENREPELSEQTMQRLSE